MFDLFPETANPYANLLPYDGIVSDFGRIFTAAEADRYFEILQRDIPWRHDEAVIFGKHIITAREVAWYGDTSYNYGYSGANRIALPWNGVLPELKNRVEAAIADICPTRFNSCLLNRYNNGNEGMAWHSDEGQGLAKDSAIASSASAQRANLPSNTKKARKNAKCGWNTASSSSCTAKRRNTGCTPS